MTEAAGTQGGGPSPGTALFGAVSAEAVAAILRKTGYRASVVTQGGVPQVQSAAQGLGFLVAFGNPASDAGDAWVDFSLQCLIAIEGELPAGLVDDWNRGMRFARLFRQDQLLVLAMDVVVAGGVTEAFLCTQFELWDRVIRDLLRHLRGDGVRREATAPGASAAA
jgi:hypothetical protein